MDRIGAPAFVGTAMLLSAVMGTSMALTNTGFPSGITAPFERDEDCWNAVPRFASAAAVWSTYTDVQPELPLHARTIRPARSRP